MTPQRITVIQPGSKYQPSCKVCGWTGISRTSLGDAQIAARIHAKGCS